MHHFELTRPDDPRTVVATASTRMALRAPHLRSRPFLIAAPNPLPRHERAPLVRLEWDTGDGAHGRVVFVQRLGGSKNEIIFARGSVGSRLIDWIKSGTRYEFRLYRGDAAHPLVTLHLGTEGDLREYALDVGMIPVIIAFTPLVVASRAGITSRVWSLLRRRHRSSSPPSPRESSADQT